MKSSSLYTGIPSSLAFASFDPAPGPATTNDVFFETLDAAFPPSFSIIWFPSSRDSFSNVPVKTIVNVIKEFKGVEHRIEYCGSPKGVDYYNDSKGTNPDASIKAVMAMVKPIVLIGGGYDKKADYTDWVKTFEGRVKNIVLIGETAQDIKKCCIENGFEAVTMCVTFEEAVAKCAEIAKEGDCVLLSPACASWGMFDNFEQRGDLFKELVSKM